MCDDISLLGGDRGRVLVALGFQGQVSSLERRVADLQKLRERRLGKKPLGTSQKTSSPVLTAPLLLRVPRGLSRRVMPSKGPLPWATPLSCACGLLMLCRLADQCWGAVSNHSVCWLQRHWEV